MVYGNAEYVAMMQRLSKSTSKPIDSLYRKYLRRLNKVLGRPSTQDVGIISDVVSKLKVAAENQLSASIDRVVVTTPRFEALTSEDLNDALEHSGLRSWLIYSLPYPTRISEANAAFAANGNGLCKQYTNLYECQEETEDMPLHQVYAVTYCSPFSSPFNPSPFPADFLFSSFTQKALYTALVPITNAFSNTADQHLVDFAAGLDSLTSYASTAAYWAHVRAQLRSTLESATGWGRRPITKVILLGESATNLDFQTALKDALSGVTMLPSAEVSLQVSAEQPEMSSDVVADPVYAAARGAALYARWRQEVPWNCTERETCEDERRRDRAAAVSREL